MGVHAVSIARKAEDEKSHRPGVSAGGVYGLKERRVYGETYQR